MSFEEVVANMPDGSFWEIVQTSIVEGWRLPFGVSLVITLIVVLVIVILRQDIGRYNIVKFFRSVMLSAIQLFLISYVIIGVLFIIISGDYYTMQKWEREYLKPYVAELKEERVTSDKLVAGWEDGIKGSKVHEISFIYNQEVHDLKEAEIRVIDEGVPYVEFVYSENSIPDYLERGISDAVLYVPQAMLIDTNPSNK